MFLKCEKTMGIICSSKNFVSYLARWAADDTYVRNNILIKNSTFYRIKNGYERLTPHY